MLAAKSSKYIEARRQVTSTSSQAENDEMLPNTLLSLLAILGVATPITALVIRGHLDDITNEETTPINATTRLQQAEDILNFTVDDYMTLEDERNMSSKAEAEYVQQDPPGVSPDLNQNSTTINSTSSGTPLALGSSQSMQQVPSTSRKRDARIRTHPSLHLTAVKWPITTESGITLDPIQKVSLDTVKELALRAEADARNRFINHQGDSWKSENGYYGFTYNEVSLMMAEVPGIFNGSDSLDWAVFEWVARFIHNVTDQSANSKSFVGTLAVNKNTTVVAHWAVTWNNKDVYRNSSGVERVWNSNFTITNITSGGGGGKVKRQADSLLNRRDNSFRELVIYRPIREAPGFVETGFKILAFSGAQLVQKGLIENVLFKAASGMFWDTMEARTVGDQPLDAALVRANQFGETGPYYLSADYLPQIVKRLVGEGIHIAFVQGFSVSAQALGGVFRALATRLPDLMWATAGRQERVASVYGAIQGPYGDVVGWFSVGQAITDVAAKVALKLAVEVAHNVGSKRPWLAMGMEEVGDEDVAGKFMMLHDEL